MKKTVKKNLLNLLMLSAFFGVLSGAAPAFAADLLVNPLLIDEDMQTRDVITKDIVVTNKASYRLVFFPTVNEIELDTSGKVKEFISPSMTDQTDTVTSWLEIVRGRQEINPGASSTIPLTIRIHPYAKPGIYFAFVGMVPADNQPEAQAKAMRGDADGTIIKITIQDKKSDLLRISSFLLDRFIFLSSHRDISIEVENKGDTDSIPKGEIIFYNSRGEEVSSVKVNDENISIPPNETRSLKAQIPFSDKLGRFKANVKLDYGARDKVSIFDTAQFFMIPFKIMIAIVVLIVLLSFVVTRLLHRAFYDELHDEDDGKPVALYVRNDREHETKDHDIHIKKN